MSVIQRANEYLREVRTEASKVSWPTRREVIASTWVVIVAVGIIAAYLFVIDQIFVRVLALLFGTPGA